MGVRVTLVYVREGLILSWYKVYVIMIHEGGGMTETFWRWVSVPWGAGGLETATDATTRGTL